MCVTAFGNETHSVCVCTYHQNSILLVDAAKFNDAYKSLIAKIV